MDLNLQRLHLEVFFFTILLTENFKKSRPVNISHDRVGKLEGFLIYMLELMGLLRNHHNPSNNSSEFTRLRSVVSSLSTFTRKNYPSETILIFEDLSVISRDPTCKDGNARFTRAGA